jgi:hypothetical protein
MGKQMEINAAKNCPNEVVLLSKEEAIESFKIL